MKSNLNLKYEKNEGQKVSQITTVENISTSHRNKRYQTTP